MVGTWFGRRFWGTGANRESKALVAHLAFAVLGLHRLGSYSNPENVRSTRALLGVGLRHEGVLRGWHRHGDRHLDVNVFGHAARRVGGMASWRGSPSRVEGAPPPGVLRPAGCSQLKPRTAKTMPSAAHRPITSEVAESGRRARAGRPSRPRARR